MLNRLKCCLFGLGKRRLPQFTLLSGAPSACKADGGHSASRGGAALTSLRGPGWGMEAAGFGM